MTTFITRVELHGADYNDYQNLHAAMARAGFVRTIVGDDGQTYKLPTAEYRIESSSTALLVRDAAKTAANTTGRNSWVLTSQSVTTAWYLDSA
jgi:Endoribonuclease GhoS